jgi:membrane dipeptidase
MRKNGTRLLVSCLILVSARPSLTPQVKADGAKAFEHVRFLASDELAGRKSGTSGYAKAADYVAARMKEIGLRPGAENGTWFQEVPFRNWSNFDQPLRLEIITPQGRRYFPGRGRDFVPVIGTGSGVVRGIAVYAGYGIVSADPPWNDYLDLDIQGCIVIIFPNAPPDFGVKSSREWTLEKKVRLAGERGAAGLIELDLNETGQVARRQRGPAAVSLRPGACPPGFIVLQAGRNFLDDLSYLAKKSWRDAASKLLRLKRPHSFSFGAEIEMEAHFIREERKAVNVIGLLPGRDPKLKNEYIIMGGHLDHLGIGLDGFVYPGADDNAVSAATVLETARVLAGSGLKPARSIVFASWAGEELGLVGSRYYADHPIYPLDKTVVYLNVDMVGAGDSDLLVGGMWEYGRFYEIVKAGLDPQTVQKLKPRLNYRGSDHTAFWAKGVTAISLRTGEILTEKLDDEHPEYHHPGDRPELIDPELLRLAAQYHVDIIRHLANWRENLLDPKFRAEFVHKDATVVDLHCDTIGRFLDGEDLRQDLPSGHIDIPKLKRGAVDLQVFACFVSPPEGELEKSQAAKKIFRQVEGIHRLAAGNPAELEIVKSFEDVSRLRNSGKTGIVIGIEGGYAIENDLDLLRAFHRADVRLMTLTHWTRTDWADASGDAAAELGGLTEFGTHVIKEMNRLGMVIDVSHVHDETFWDVLKVTEAPVVASHSCCRALSPHHRNLSDEMLLALAKNRGVIGINFLPGFLNSEIEKKESELLEAVAKKYGLSGDFGALSRAEPGKRDRVLTEFKAQMEKLQSTLPPVDVRTLVDHIDHVVKVTGSANHVGLGSDFDGIDRTPAGLENMGKLVAVTEELQRRGYKEEDIRKILGGNFLRLFQAVQATAKK